MILYLDTSALVKAYVSENSSRDVLKAIKHSHIVSSHILAYVETLATFSRIKREKKISEKEFDIVKLSFIADWKNYLHIETTQELMQHAADLADAFSLRAYDSVHLAAANLLFKQSKQAVTFACFDNQLNKAGHILGLQLLDVLLEREYN